MSEHSDWKFYAVMPGRVVDGEGTLILRREAVRTKSRTAPRQDVCLS